VPWISGWWDGHWHLDVPYRGARHVGRLAANFFGASCSTTIASRFCAGQPPLPATPPRAYYHLLPVPPSTAPHAAYAPRLHLSMLFLWATFLRYTAPGRRRYGTGTWHSSDAAAWFVTFPFRLRRTTHHTHSDIPKRAPRRGTASMITTLACRDAPPAARCSTPRPAAVAG